MQATAETTTYYWMVAINNSNCNITEWFSFTPAERRTQVNLSGLTPIYNITWSGDTEDLPKPTFCNNSGIYYETMIIEIDINSTTYVEQIDIWAGNLTNATIIDAIGGDNITCWVSIDNITWDILQCNWWGYGPGVFAAYPYSISNQTWNFTTSPVGIDPFTYYGDSTYITTDCTLYVRFQCNLSGVLYEQFYTNFTAWYVEISNNTKAWSNLEYYNGMMNVTVRDWQNIQAWNGTIYNVSNWNNIASWNGTIYNQTRWNNVQAWNGTIYNVSNWQNIQSWNGTIYNTSNWYNIQSWNGTIYNTSRWNNVQAWNGTIYNVTTGWQNIETWNGTIYNVTTGWQNIQAWNGTVFNTSAIDNITVSDPYPANNSINIPLQIIAFVTITNLNGNPMTLRFFNGTTQMGATQSGLGNGTYNQLYYPATEYNTEYSWRVYANDGTNHVNETYNFTTRSPAVGGSVSSRSIIGIVGIIGLVGLFGGLMYSRRKRRRYE